MNQENKEEQKEQKNNELTENFIDFSNQQLSFLQAEIEMSGPLITKIISLDFLQEEFKNNEIFSIKIKLLREKYKKFRRLRRDGSCFYRALIFGIFERIIEKKDVTFLKSFTEFIKNSVKDLKNVGYEETVTEYFLNTILEKLEFCEQNILNIQDLETIFCEKYISDSFVMYMRFLTSGYLKMNAILYENYLDGYTCIDSFCSKEVDPIDREADQVQIMALISYLGIKIKILYLDTNTVKMEPQTINIPEDAKDEEIILTLLYRPGHYDILYSE